MTQPAYVPPAQVVPYTPAVPGNWSPQPLSTAGGLDQLAARPRGTTVLVLGNTQGPAVGIGAADTPLGTGVGHTFTGTETVEISAVATFANISEGGGQPSDLTFGVLFSGGDVGTRSIESYSAGEVGATLAFQAGTFTPAAGVHAIIMVATASAGAGNCQVPAGGANLIVRIYS